VPSAAEQHGSPALAVYGRIRRDLRNVLVLIYNKPENVNVNVNVNVDFQ
jgi:hypothetical protein